MACPIFEIGSEVHIARNHCPTCGELESELKHPVRIESIQDYGDRGFAYRVRDAGGVHYEVSEPCLCSSATGHSSSPCQFCQQSAA